MKRFLLFTSLLACGKVAPQSMPDGNGGGDDDAGGSDAASASLDLMPTAIDFGQVSIAEAPAAQPVVITNHTGVVTTITLAVSGDDAASFTIDRGTCAAQVPDGSSCMASVALTVGHDGAYQASLDASAGTLHASSTLAAMALSASLAVSPPIDDFGDVGLATASTRQYTITNTGTATLPAPTIAVSGGAAYTLDSSTCASTLVPTASCVFAVKFKPTAVGTQTAAAALAAGALTAQAQLTGRGTSQLSAVRQGTGAGTVSGGGLNCGGTCAATVATNPVTLTATAAGGSVFSGWGGAAASCGTNPTCTVAIATGSVAVTAGFTDLPTLDVDVNATGGDNSVTIDNPPTTCTNSCSFDYPAATTVHLTAHADTVDCLQFDGWSGACFGQGTTCTLTVNANLSASAGFSKKPGCTPP